MFFVNKIFPSHSLINPKFLKPSIKFHQNCLHSISLCTKKEVEIQFDIPRQNDEGSRQLMDGVWCCEGHFHYQRWLYLFDLRCSMFHCYFGILLDGSKMAKQAKFLIVKMHKNAHQSSNCNQMDITWKFGKIGICSKPRKCCMCG